MRIIQLTDLHIGLEGEDTRGVDVRNNFLQLLQKISSNEPDLLVVTGDLAYMDGNREIYGWIKTQLSTLSCPYAIISGNHDDPAVLIEVFEEYSLENGSIYYEKRLSNISCLFLDTTTGYLTPPQMEWLKTKLQTKAEEILIFMHHPPLYSQVPYMDNKYFLKNRQEVENILLEQSRNIHVFSGHYHVDKTIVRNNIILHLTPSCFFQIDQDHQDFKVDHHRVGYREILVENGSLFSTVKYL